MDIVQAFYESRVVAVIRTKNADVAANAMEAAVRGGFRILEFTWTTPGAAELVREFARRPELVVGGGTILRTEDAEVAVRAGARFLVSPVLDERVIDAALAAKVTPIPGCGTPSEMWRAHERGAPMQKRFPAGAGPAEIRAILDAMPFLKIVPTNGTDLGNVAAYLSAGAWACGPVASLFPPELLARGDWAAIEENARLLVAEAGRAVSRRT
jgi:2-dehydro-3-deoxyphosphogluconate aldolase / (4S)-4-hydroxy-2-oxoglutarate aldolase